jgi:hypothetical protein
VRLAFRLKSQPARFHHPLRFQRLSTLLYAQPAPRVVLRCAHSLVQFSNLEQFVSSETFLEQGPTDVVNELIDAYNSGRSPDLEKRASLGDTQFLLVQYLVRLPESLMTPHVQEEMYTVELTDLMAIKAVIRMLPVVNQNILLRLSLLAHKLAAHGHYSWRQIGEFYGPAILQNADHSLMIFARTALRLLARCLQSVAESAGSRDC